MASFRIFFHRYSQIVVHFSIAHFLLRAVSPFSPFNLSPPIFVLLKLSFDQRNIRGVKFLWQSAPLEFSQEDAGLSHCVSDEACAEGWQAGTRIRVSGVVFKKPEKSDFESRRKVEGLIQVVRWYTVNVCLVISLIFARLAEVGCFWSVTIDILTRCMQALFGFSLSLWFLSKWLLQKFSNSYTRQELKKDRKIKLKFPGNMYSLSW